MKRLLLVMPNYYGFDEVVFNGLVKYSGYEVFKLNYDVGFQYEHTTHRLNNFLSKTFLGINLKDRYKEAYFVKYIKSLGDLDALVVNRPDILPVGLLDKLTYQVSDSRLILWDSLSKIPMDKTIFDKFKTVYSFDQMDCASYGFRTINNFYFDTLGSKSDVVYDTMFLGTLDNRISDLQQLWDYIASIGLKAKAYLHLPKGRKLKERTDMEVLDGIVPFKDSVSFARKTRVIVDLAHRDQLGLSFRFFEAMGLQKKMITTNTAVRNYDFFKESNIFVIDDISNFSIPSSFWEEEYEKLPDTIVQKYSLEQWVHRVIE